MSANIVPLSRTALAKVAPDYEAMRCAIAFTPEQANAIRDYVARRERESQRLFSEFDALSTLEVVTIEVADDEVPENKPFAQSTDERADKIAVADWMVRDLR